MALLSKTASGSFSKAARFLREVRNELRKVAWPNRKELIIYTTVVLISVAVASVYLGLVDLILSEVLSLLNRLGG